MKLDYRQTLAQKQKMVMTPQLRQGIEILQYNSIELDEFIQHEMESNPLLEKDEKSPNAEKYEALLSDRTSYRGESAPDDDNGDEGPLSYVGKEESLLDHLLFQLLITELAGNDLAIAKFLINNVDENGYLAFDRGNVLRRFDIFPEKLESIISVIQSFDPAGVCARSLSECLLLQIRAMGIEDNDLVTLTRDYLDELAKNKLLHVSHETGIPLLRIKECLSIIRKLEPKPGRAYGSARELRYVMPDVIVEYRDGERVVSLSDQTAPSLLVSNYYRNLLENRNIDEGTRNFISDKISAALLIIKNIEQRKNTIKAVVSAILDFQEDFFRNGLVGLKTMTLRDIADATGLHESTVSRAVNGKYIQTEKGMYEIRYFFQKGVTAESGDGISSETIKSVIKELIDSESKKKPLSDNKIAIKLVEMGINISRRTVAKYRDEMNIPPTTSRKEF